MLAALEKAGISTGLHEYPVGGHGFGYGKNEYNNNAPAGWLDRVLDWLKSPGLQGLEHIQLVGSPDNLLSG